MIADDALNQPQTQEEKDPKKKSKDGHIDTAKHQKLEAEIVSLQQQAEEMKHKWLRVTADYQNLEKRLEKEKQDWIKFANANLILKILEVADNLDRAAAFINDAGLEMVRNHFKTVLKEFGVEEIPVENKEFDHNTMEAIDRKEGKENQVLEVVQKGYTMHDKVLRPAKVIVGFEENK